MQGIDWRRFLLGLTCLGAASLSTLPLGAASVEEVVALVEKIAGQGGLRNAQVGFCLLELEAPRESAVGYHLDMALVPASTMKAITTATANERLEADFRFVTELQITGPLEEEGVLQGDVVIRGGGDPTLAETDLNAPFAKWKVALVQAGVKRVAGSVVGDASIFGNVLTPDTWQWNDMGNYYGAGASGLNVHRNLFHATFRTAKVGGRAPLEGTQPALPGYAFFNEMRVGAAGSGDQGYVYADPYGQLITFRGSVPAGRGTYTIKGALPDPAFFCARRFSEYLQAHGIPVEGEPSTDRRLAMEGKEIGARRKLLEMSSEPLSALMRTTNHRSDNLRAECLHRAIGVQAEGEGSPQAAARAVESHWAGKGIDMRGFFMGDGCGLSRANMVTPRQMALILHEAAKGERFAVFRDSLPVAGRSGTLKSIGAGTAAEGRVRAKSGTMSRIRNYAGYVETRSGKVYAFALFVTNYSGELAEVRSKIVQVWNRMVDL